MDVKLCHQVYRPLEIMLNKQVILLLLMISALLVNLVIRTIYSYMRASSFREIDPPLIHNSLPFLWSYSNLLLFNCCFLTSFQPPVQFYSNFNNTFSHCFSYCFLLTILFPTVFHILSQYFFPHHVVFNPRIVLPPYLYLSFSPHLLTEDDSSLSRNV